MNTPAKKMTTRANKATIEAELFNSISNLDTTWLRLWQAENKVTLPAGWDEICAAFNRVQRAATRAINAIPEDDQ